MSPQNKRSWRESRWMLFFCCLMVSLMLAIAPLSQSSLKAQEESNKKPADEKDAPSVEYLAAHPSMKSVQAPDLNRPAVTNATAFVSEVEPNNTFGTAQALAGSSVRVRGNVQFNRVPNPPQPNDLDFYSFSGTMGDRVYAAVQTSYSNGGSGLTGDSVIELLGTDGATILESDDEDGTFSGSSSSIAGAVLPSTGTFFIKVRHFSATPASEIQPYDLYLRVQTGLPTPESEPNNNAGPPNMPNPLPANGWVSGTIDPVSDNDVFSIALNAGDTVFLSLDANPERDASFWNPRIGFGLFDNFFLLANDANAGSVANSNSEALFWTVREAGTYLIYVDSAVAATGGPTFTYHMSASVYPGDTTRTCTTYTSTDVPKAIGPDPPTITTSTIVVPDNKRIGNLKVSLNITHAALGDLDVSLIAPDGNEVVLFDDPPAASAGTTAPQIDFTLDEEAGLPVVLFGVNKSMIFQPESLSRLSWFKNQKAMGTWTLRIFDDTAGNAGTLNGWSITVCEDPPIPPCAGTETTVYSSDFEANDGMFTHTGTNDEWERGLPSFAPITTCNSGVNCWKTDLDNTYNAAPTSTTNVFQELVSPNIDLTMLMGQSITFEWAMKYNVEGAHWDHAFVEVREVGGGGLIRRVFEHQGPTMQRTVGSGPTVTINSAAGWGLWQVVISEFAGKTVQLVFHLDNDDSVQLTGLAIDDVKVKACSASCPTSIVPNHQSYPGGGGMSSIAVTASGTCNWTATTAATWIHITGGTPGMGNGTVNYTVDANPGPGIRSDTITIGALTFTVYQGIDFVDVPPSHDFYTEIGKLSARGVTLGCNPTGPLYCPNDPVLREQMAAFLMRALGEFNPPMPAMQRFGDVPPSNQFYNFIDRLAVLGITLGCQPGMPPLYCPTDAVKRENMSAFILRALGEFNPPMPAMQRFGDVPPSNDFYNFIDRLAVLGITNGCQPGNPPLFCPSDPVSRGQMAAFLVRAFNL